MSLASDILSSELFLLFKKDKVP